MIKNIIFDMGNVLIEFEGKAIINKIASNKEEAKLIYNSFFGSKEWLMLDKGTITTDELIKATNAKLPPYLHPKIEEALSSWHQKPIEVKGMYQLISQLKKHGYKLYVLSNTSLAYHEFRNNIPAVKFMDGEMISADEHLLKPSHKIFNRLLEEFSLIAEECYFVDDSVPNVLSATELGFEGYIFRNDVKDLRLDLSKHGVLNGNISAVIFDLDGVIVSTDKQHFNAWKRLADKLNISFSQKEYSAFRGVSRKDCIDILQKLGNKTWSQEEKNELGDLKNSWYKNELEYLDASAIMPGIISLLDKLDEKGILLAIGSSSQNATNILEKIGLLGRFHTIVDGKHITRSKPYPDVFTMGANQLGVPYEKCLVIEDATAGIDAGLAAGMVTLGVGEAASYKKSDFSAESVEDFPYNIL